MNKTIFILALAVIATVCAVAAHGQTTNGVAPSNNELVAAISNVVIDTNSTFFADAKYQVRSGALESDSTFADLGADLNLSRFQIGADVLTQGSANLISEAGVDVAFRIPVHNVELDLPLVGASWNWDENTPLIRAGLRFSYQLTSRGFAFVQSELVENATKFDRPNSRIMAGIGFAF